MKVYPFRNTSQQFVTDRVVELCQQLIKIESVNPPGKEFDIARYVANVLKAIGLDVEFVDHGNHRASVLASLKQEGTNHYPGFVLSGHLDTVPPGNKQWNSDPFGGKLLDGKIWGRGSADMKGGVAAMIMATEILVREQLSLNGNLFLAFTADEEVESLGAKTLADRLAAHELLGVLIGEPSGNALYIAEKGALWLELTTHGRSAHGSAPEEGANAISMMMILLEQLDSVLPVADEHPLLGRFTQSVNTIHGGVKTNVIPDQCTVTVDMRTLPGQNHAEIIGAVNSLLFRLSQETKDFRASAHIVNDRRPVMVSRDEPIVALLLEVIEQVTGRETEPEGVSYYTDASAFAQQLVAPMVICGPGIAAQAHQTDEYVEVNRLVEAAWIYATSVARLLS